VTGARAIALRTKLNKHEKKSDDNDTDLRYWRDQEELLKDVPASMMFREIEDDKKAERNEV